MAVTTTQQRTPNDGRCPKDNTVLVPVPGDPEGDYFCPFCGECFAASDAEIQALSRKVRGWKGARAS